jgi:hypothetical protein
MLNYFILKNLGDFFQKNQIELNIF